MVSLIVDKQMIGPHDTGSNYRFLNLFGDTSNCLFAVKLCVFMEYYSAKECVHT